MPIALSVNLNKIALLRNSRQGHTPEVLDFARRAIHLGAQGLTVHPRPDQRHIRPGDVKDLACLVEAFPDIELNVEGNPFAPARDNYPGLVKLIASHKVHQCTLVPDDDKQLTSDHGFDLEKDGEKLRPVIDEIKRMGARVSLFMDPDIAQIKRAKQIGADRIELYTGPFALANETNSDAAKRLFLEHVAASETALSLGMGVNAGHDLNLQNMLIYRDLPGLQEVSIGHALTVDALHMGFTDCIQAYLKVCRETSTKS